MGISLRRVGICICWIASFGSVDNLAVGAEHENGGFTELGKIKFHFGFLVIFFPNTQMSQETKLKQLFQEP